MPYSPADLRAEIRKMIDDEIDLGRTIARPWLAHAILSKHPLDVTRHREFHQLCGKLAVNEAVLEVLRGMHRDEEDPAVVAGPATLPGFVHLKKLYSITRGKKQVIVPIDKMTATERNTRADEYERMSAGCAKHAEELRRYTPSAHGLTA